ncbi:MAG: hypothetical protein Kow0074_20230 [Candidatus Zixiibacteriota bacterium]
MTTPQRDSLRGLPELTAADVEAVDWKQALDSIDDPDEFRCQHALEQLEKGAAKAGDKAAEKLWRVLASLMSMALKPDDLADPFRSQLQMKNRRTAQLDDFSTDILEVLGPIAETASNPSVAARIGDCLWCRKRDHRMAELAIDKYLEATYRWKAKGKFSRGWATAIRAARIALQLGRNAAVFTSTMGKIDALLQACEGDDASRMALDLLNFIHEIRWGEDPNVYASTAGRFAELEARRNRLDFARSFWEVQCKFLARAKGSNQVINSVRKKIAESFEKQGAIGSHLQRAHWLRKAIAAWRAVPNSGEKVSGLLQQLKEEQRLAIDEMRVISTEFDASAFHEAGRKCVEGKEPLDALLCLGMRIRPMTRKQAKDEIQELMKSSPLPMIVGHSTQVPEGNVAATIPGYSFDGDNSEWELAHTILRYAERQKLYGMSLIEAARLSLLDMLGNDRSVWHALLQHNPFIPDGREDAFTRGLIAGLQGDFPLCAHILVPQLENAIRNVVERQGGRVTEIPREGPKVQREVGLHKLLCDQKISAKTIEIFGDDLVMEMRALLVEGVGPNLRNRVCHGLSDWHGLDCPEARYLWWLVIHLCAFGFIMSQRDDPEVSGETRDDPSGTAPASPGESHSDDEQLRDPD